MSVFFEKTRAQRRPLQNRADGGAYLGPLLYEVVTGDPRSACGRRQEPREHEHGGAFTGPVGA
jgi:hypothetical protein